MATDWSMEMQEALERFRQAFSEDLRGQLLATEARLSERLETRLSDRLETLAEQIETRLSGRLAARLPERVGRQNADQIRTLGQELEQRLGDRLRIQLAGAEERLDQRLGARLQLQAEELRDLVRVAAEGYGGTLERIERDLGEFRSEWRTRSADTDRILAHHVHRIEALERATGLAPE